MVTCFADTHKKAVFFIYIYTYYIIYIYIFIYIYISIKAEHSILCPCVHLAHRLGEGRRAFLLQRPPTSWNFATWQFQNMSWKVCLKTNGGAKLTKLAQVVEIIHKESRVDQNN